MTDKKKSPPVLAQRIISGMKFYEKNFALAAGIEEEYYDKIIEKGVLNANFWYWLQTLQIIFKHSTSAVYRSKIMIKSYIKISSRNIFKNKAYSAVNIGGLALGMACCFLIMLYVTFELSYDDYHPGAGSIYRIGLTKSSPGGERTFAQNSASIFPIIKDEYPQVENAFRIRYETNISVKYEEKAFYEQRIAYADPEIFQMLSIDIIKGEAQTALARPDGAIISESISEKYFGDENPIGKALLMNGKNIEVRGIFKDLPLNTHLKADMILTFPAIEENRRLYVWGNTSTFTYIKLNPEVDKTAFEDQIKYFVHDHNPDIPRDGITEFIYFLQPLKDIHLYSNLTYEAEPPGNIYNIYLFSSIAILIMLIACFNFMNLSTAKSSVRSCEIGLRKVVGAHRRQLIIQFLGESVLISVLAFISSVMLTILILPFFNEITAANFIYRDLFETQMLSFMIGFILLTGITAGFYPALIMSSYNPVQVFKGLKDAGNKGDTFRKILVTGQFAISVLLIICTIVVYEQIDFMKQMNPGFDREQKLIIDFPSGSPLTGNYEAVKDEFKRHTSITDASASFSTPGSDYRSLRMFPSDEPSVNSHSVNANAVDHDYISFFDIQVVAGRSFTRESRADTLFGGFIMNEAAVRLFGWESPETALEKYMWEQNIPVIGVVKDYHYKGVQNKVEPILLYIYPGNYKSMTLSVKTENLGETLSFIQNKFRELFPDLPFRYSFCDEYFNRHYRVEERIGKVAGIFTLVGILIACLGLFSLAAFIVERRRKEIGIRKVLGGSSGNITVMLGAEFIKWVGLGTAIAAPAAWLAVISWLQNFAYRINPGITIFLSAIVLVLLIAVITVSFQTVRAARTNPVKALRYE
ncbi:ABC transporter permease [candidate division KSB1 bacterium]